jgi:carbonic anhydrase
MNNFKVPYRFEGIHTTEAAVLCCIDFRFWKETMQFVEEGLGIKSYDFPKLPGSTKAIIEAKDNDITMACIGVPCDLHHVKKIVVVDHEDCGAYGGSVKFDGDVAAEQAFHTEQLHLAKEILAAKYPGKEIILAYARLADENTNVEFVLVD